jgi:hypothetical protein
MPIQPKPYCSFEDYLVAEHLCIDAKHGISLPFSQDGRWLLEDYIDTETPIHLEPTGCKVLLREVYQKVEFESATDMSDPQ